MSHYVMWRGKPWPRSFLEPLDVAPEACPRCGGVKVIAEQIDEERYDVAVTCPQCKGSGLREKPKEDE